MSKKHAVLLWIAILIIALLVVVLLMEDSIIRTILISLLCSGIAGLVVSFFADFPNVVDGTVQATAKVFLSMDFLKQYSNDLLEKFRKRAILIRYKKEKEDDGIVRQVLSMEPQLCGLLEQPFYEYYLESHSYSVLGGKQVKTITMDYLIKKDENGQPTKIDIGILKFFSQSFSSVGDSQFTMEEFTIRIDESERKSIARFIKRELSSANDEEELNHRAYTSVFRFYINGELTENNLSEFCRIGYVTDQSSNSKNGIVVSFKKEVEVHAVCTIPFDEDLVFAKKMRYFAKSFTFDSNSPEGYGIQGAILSPFAPNKKTVVTVAKNKLHIECRTGLLPGSGIVSALFKKEDGADVASS